MQIIEYINLYDIKLFLFLNNLHTPFFDTIMFFISKKFVWVPLYALLLFVIYKKYKTQTLYLLFLVLIFIVVSDQSTVFIKNYFQRLRPCHNPDIIEMVHLVNNYCGGTFGFISSHASNTFSLAIFIIYFLHKYYKWITLPILFWAGIVSYSRIYLGAHYPLDIFFGAVWGIFITLLVVKVSIKLKPQFFKI